MRKVLLLLVLCLLPESGHAQRTVFNSLLDGYITYRPTAAWRELRTIRDSHSQGVLLVGRSPADSSLSALLIAYPRPRTGGFSTIADSLLKALVPGRDPIRSWDAGNDTLRVVSWSADTPNGRIMGIDRLVLLRDALLYARVAMPAIPPADPDQISGQLEIIDDFLTSIHSEGRVLFPAGAQLAIKVF